jgi:hypothetical protein
MTCKSQHDWGDWQAFRLRRERVERQMKSHARSAAYGCPEEIEWDNLVVRDDQLVSVRVCKECGQREYS